MAATNNVAGIKTRTDPIPQRPTIAHPSQEGRWAKICPMGWDRWAKKMIKRIGMTAQWSDRQMGHLMEETGL